MKRTTGFLGVTTGLLIATTLLPNPAHALLIDNFTVSQTVTQTGVGTSGIGATGVTGAIFGDRYLQATVTQGTASLRVSANGLNPGQLTHSQDSGVTGNSLTIWDANSANGDIIDLAPGRDLTDTTTSNSLVFEIVSADFPTNLTFTAYTTLSDFSRIQFNTPGLLSNAPVFLPFATFTAFGGGADFANIRALTMSVADTIPREDLDLRLRLLQTSSPPTFDIIEPTSLAIFGAGLAGLGFSARRRKPAALPAAA